MYKPLKAVLFDLDGVLVHSPLDLAAIKRELFGDSGIYIIEGLENLPDDEKEIKNGILLQRELEAATESVIDESVESLFRWMDENGLKRGVVTRNHRDVVNEISGIHGVDFGVIIARDDARPKPDPDSVLKACDKLGVDPSETAMVGDFTFDIEAGKNAGCRTVFIETDKYRHLESGEDVRIKSLGELKSILKDWLNEEVNAK